MSIFKNGKEIVRVLLTDKDGHDADVDTRSSNLGTIDVEHKRIHNGESYYHRDFVDLASSASRQFILTTPDTAMRVHIVFEFEFESETSVVVTEGVSTSGDGTAITELNRDRNSANTATLILTHTPTSPTGGTVIGQSQKGDGKKAGGLTRGSDELILKQNTKYLVDITNESAGASLTNWVFDWYEEI